MSFEKCYIVLRCWKLEAGNRIGGFEANAAKLIGGCRWLSLSSVWYQLTQKFIQKWGTSWTSFYAVFVCVRLCSMFLLGLGTCKTQCKTWFTRGWRPFNAFCPHEGHSTVSPATNTLSYQRFLSFSVITCKLVCQNYVLAWEPFPFISDEHEIADSVQNLSSCPNPRMTRVFVVRWDGLCQPADRCVIGGQRRGRSAGISRCGCRGDFWSKASWWKMWEGPLGWNNSTQNVVMNHGIII
jgi:hypothetical protein